MNAGAYGGEMKDVLRRSHVVMNQDGEILTDTGGEAGAGIPDQHHNRRPDISCWKL